MAEGFDIEGIATAKMLYGGTVKSAGAMWLNGRQVWPKVSYVITSARVVYSESAAYPGQSLDYIAAKGDNYATIVGTVEKRRGTRVKETYADVALIPVNSSASSVFYISDTNQIHAYDLQCSIRQMTSVIFGAKYVSGDGIESALYDVTVSQQGNQITSTVDTITAIGVGIDMSGDDFGVTGGTGTLSATKVFSRTYTCTSTHSHTDTGLTSDISDSTTYVLTGGTGATVSGRTVSVSSRAHNATAGAWVLTGNYTENGTTYTDSLDVTQTADVKISETTAASDCRISIGVSSGSTISAAGGSATLNWGGTYTLTITQYWQSDPTTPYVITQQNIPVSSEHISITESGNASGRFHRSGASVTHDDMTTNETTDSVTYTASVIIGSETLAHDSEVISATNSKSTAVSEETVRFAIEASPSEFDAGGGTAILTGREYYNRHHDYTWSSGATSRTTEAGSRSVAASFSVTPSSGCCLSGDELEIYTRTEASSGSWTVTGIWNGLTADTVITQEGVTVKEEIYISAVQDGNDVYATASSAVHSSVTVTICASLNVQEETFNVTISSGSTESGHHSVQFEPDDVSITELDPTSDAYANYLSI